MVIEWGLLDEFFEMKESFLNKDACK
jgi:hypothetical protein